MAAKRAKPTGAKAAAGQGRFLAPSRTAGYRPSMLGRAWRSDGHRGYWTVADAERMRRDPQVSFCLRILYSPLPTVKIKVHAHDREAGEIALATMERIWKRELSKLFVAVVYGWMPGEILWEDDGEGGVRFGAIRDIHPLDARPLEQEGRLAGISLHRMGDAAASGQAGRIGPNPGWIMPPRSLWIAHEAEFGSHYGRARLASMWQPWEEKTGRHGALDIRRMWYLKNAYRGGMMRHPGGVIEVAPGQFMSAADYAREIVEKEETGGVLTLPNSKAPDSADYEWTYDPPSSNGDVAGVLDYCDKLDREMLIGAHIPPEVVDAAASGSGWSGRNVPFLTFLKGEDGIADCLGQAAWSQVAMPQVAAMRGERAALGCELELSSLVPEEAKGDPTAGRGGSGALGQQALGGAVPPGSEPPAQMAHDANPWTAYEGPRGGTGWKNSATGGVRYGGERPAADDAGEAEGGASPDAAPGGFSSLMAGIAEGDEAAEETLGKAGEAELRAWGAEAGRTLEGARAVWTAMRDDPPSDFGAKVALRQVAFLALATAPPGPKLPVASADFDGESVLLRMPAGPLDEGASFRLRAFLGMCDRTDAVLGGSVLLRPMPGMDADDLEKVAKGLGLEAATADAEAVWKDSRAPFQIAVEDVPEEARGLEGRKDERGWHPDKVALYKRLSKGLWIKRTVDHEEGKRLHQRSTIGSSSENYEIVGKADAPNLIGLPKRLAEGFPSLEGQAVGSEVYERDEDTATGKAEERRQRRADAQAGREDRRAGNEERRQEEMEAGRRNRASKRLARAHAPAQDALSDALAESELSWGDEGTEAMEALHDLDPDRADPEEVRGIAEDALHELEAMQMSASGEAAAKAVSAARMAVRRMLLASGRAGRELAGERMPARLSLDEAVQLASDAARHPIGQPWKGSNGKWFVRREKDGRTVPAADPSKKGLQPKAEPGAGKKGGAKPEPKPKPEKKEKPKPEPKPKGDPAAAEKAIRAILASGKGIDEAGIKAVAESLLSLTVAQIGQLKKALGVKATGQKAELARKVAEQALAKARAGAPGGSVAGSANDAMDDLPPPKPQIRAVPPEPGFTGFDTLGREWRDGELVPAKEDQAEASDFRPVGVEQAVGASKRAMQALAAASRGGRSEGARVRAPEEAMAELEKAGLVKAGALTRKGVVAADLADDGVDSLGAEEADSLIGYLGKGEESQWLADAFGAKDGRELRERARAEKKGGAGKAIRKAIRGNAAAVAKVDSIARAAHVEGWYEENRAIVKAIEETETEVSDILGQWKKAKGGSKAAKAAAHKEAFARLATLRERKESHRKQRDAAAQRDRQAVRESLLLPDGKASAIHMPGDVARTHGGGTAEKVKGAIGWLSGIVARQGWADLPPVKVSDQPIDRAHYSESNGHMRISQDEPEGVIIHEWCHQLEYKIPGLSEAVKAFLAHRCGDEPLIDIGTTPEGLGMDGEMGRKDHFDLAFRGANAYYVGKDYGPGQKASEVVSMGVQKLYEDPVTFARRDPEYCAFIVSILDGSIRKLDGR